MKDRERNPAGSGSNSWKPTILIIDDDPDNLRLMLDCLDGCGYTTLVAEDGESGLKRASYARPDLILLDVLMPGMDGLETCRRMKSLESTKDIPVIFMTALAETEQKLRGFAAGAVDYITKPFQREEVLARIDVHLRIRELTRRLEEANELLERRVEARTAELSRANKELHAEIAERKMTEMALRESEESFRALYDENPSMYFTLDPRGVVLSVNPFGAEQLKYAVRDLLGRSVLEVFHPDDSVVVRQQLTNCLDNPGRVQSWELRKIRKDGSMLWVRENARAIEGADGQPLVLVACEDITERKQAEEALRQSEVKYRTIFENSGTAMLFIEEDTTVSLVNKEFEKLSGYSSTEVEGRKSWMEFVATEDDLKRMKEYHRLRRIDPAMAPKTYEFQMRDRFGEYRDAVVTVTTMPGTKQSLAAILDITERKRAEEDLAEARNYLDKIINSIADPIFVKDREHRWVLINDAYCNFMGYGRHELLGRSDYDYFSKSESDVFWSKDEDVFVGGVENSNEEEFTDAKGTVHTIVTRKTLYTDEKGQKYIVGIIRDITERKKLEAQLRQAVKMEAIGTLAGGVAHDFNNLMTTVLGYSDLWLMRIGENERMRRDIEQIRKAGERAASLTAQLLAFSRKQVLQPKILDLNHVVAETERMLGRLIGEHIDLVNIPHPELGRVMADPGLIGQVIMNLVINARDAMPQGGKLTIETANVCLDETYTQNHVGVEAGRYVMLAVSDTGIGMDEETLSHIFEPFFTTKEKGKGTGLGLATVYGIVKQSGGHIWVYSELGRGTTFKVYLPRAEQDTGSVSFGFSPPKVPQGRSEVILFVEDEDVVRNLGYEILRTYGYIVIEARNGQEALEIFKERGDSIQLLITDVVMPTMSGSQLAKEIGGIYPKTKVLYISGYTDNAIVHHGILDAGTAFLQKPFTPEGLAEKVRRVLDE